MSVKRFIHLPSGMREVIYEAGATNDRLTYVASSDYAALERELNILRSMVLEVARSACCQIPESALKTEG